MSQVANISDSGNAWSSSGMPVALSRFATMLFLSTEVMFFGALIAVYVIIRASAAPQQWPSLADLHVLTWLGAINTALLLCSAWTMRRCVICSGAARGSAARRWLAATILLGLGFLLIKGVEYRSKIVQGLYPVAHEQRVFDRADIYYLSALNETLRQRIAELQSLQDARAGGLTEDEQQKLAWYQNVRSGGALFTARLVAQLQDNDEKKLALAALAHQLYPTQRTGMGVATYLADHLAQVQARSEELDLLQHDLRGQLAATQQQIQGWESQLASLAQDDTAAVELRQRLATDRGVATQFAAQLTELSNEKTLIEQRLKYLRQAQPIGRGIIREKHLQLPIVLAGGDRWMNLYYLLTGCHALHVVAGLLVMAWLFWRPLTRDDFVFAGNVSWYWQLVDAVWIVLFVLLYF